MKVVLLLVLLHLCSGEGAKILGVFPATGYSQFILTEALMKELADRGHQVTVICPYAPKKSIENYSTIKTTNVLEDDVEIDLFGLDGADLFTNILTTYQYGNALTEGVLKNDQVQQLLHSEASFDLVIVEQFFDEALKGFAAHFGAPLVTLCSQGATEWSKDFMGIPSLPAISAITYTSHTNEMSFWQRVRNLMGTLFDYYYKHYVAYPYHRELMKKYFPKDMDFDTVIYNTSLMLLNSHVTTTQNELLPYNAIEVGGFHIKQRPLSAEMQELLDSARDGVILFSLGSNLKSADLSKDTLHALFRVFGKLKQKIVWKFERDFPDKPANVWISKWLNQSDILAHPNLQLFITHGGLLSTTEAIFYGVPMVGIPVFADQKMNMARASKNGVATVVVFSDLSEKTLGEAIDLVLSDNRYRDGARRLSNLMRDRIATPLDLAIYWIEYVLRHGGLYFPTAASRLTWVQIYLVDILVLFVFILVVICVSIKCLIKLLSRPKVVVRKNKQKKH